MKACLESSACHWSWITLNEERINNNIKLENVHFANKSERFFSFFLFFKAYFFLKVQNPQIDCGCKTAWY